MPELERILRITTFRVRVPDHPDFVWDIKGLKREEAKPRGTSLFIEGSAEFKEWILSLGRWKRGSGEIR